MIVQYTQIVGVESDQGTVKIKFRPQGSDSADAPLSVQITPHTDYIHMNLNHCEFTEAEGGGNTRSLKIESRH